VPCSLFFSSVKKGRWYNNSGSDQNMEYFRNKKIMERCSRSIVGLLLIALLSSCNLSKIEDFQLGQQFVDSSSGVVLIDTMNIISSTVHLDSIASSKLSRMLVGGYQNAYTGTVTCNPLFQINSGTFGTIATDFVYDSLVVKMTYDGYYVGDTTKLMTVKIKQVTKDLKVNTDGYLYNISAFKLADETLGQASFYPQTQAKNSVYFHLSDVFGRKLFNNIINKVDTLSTNTLFKDYFKGIAFVSNEAQNQAAVGFYHDSASVRVYYHEILNVADSKVKTYFSFPISSDDVWYNTINYNPSGSPLQNIADKKNELQSSLTSNQTMIQGGSGIYTKIRIPGVQNLKGYGKNVAFIFATLQLTPLKESYSVTNPLPDTLAVYIADHKNMISSQYSNSSGNIYARKVVPIGIEQSPYYELDVTQFFTTELATSTVSDHSLLFGVTNYNVGRTVNPFVLTGTDSKKNNVKLNVYAYVDKSK